MTSGRALFAGFSSGFMLVLAATPASGGARAPSTDALIAFAGGTGRHSDIYVIEADGSGRRQVTRTPLDEYCPKWSPDGRMIATELLETRGDSIEQSWLQVMTASGEQLWRVEAAAACPSWSPDGLHVAFLSYGDSDGVDLYVADADGRNVRLVASNVDGRALNQTGPAWSPDGKEIANGTINRYGDEQLALTVVRVDGSGRRLVRPKPVPKWCSGSCRFWAGGMAWAPARDVAAIMVVGDLYPERLYGIRSTNGGARLLSGKLNDVYAPAWSPGGRRIAFVGRGKQDQIWVANANGTGVRQLTKIRSRGGNLSGVFDPAWSPDGAQIACWGWGGGIYVVDLATAKSSLVVRDGGGPVSWSSSG